MREKKKQFIFKFQKKRDSVFLLFVLGTIVFWFLNKLSEVNQQSVTYHIEYKELPNEFIFQEAPKEELTFQVESNGFYFLASAFNTKTISISLKNIKKKNKYTYYILANDFTRQTKKLVKDKVKKLEAINDTLFVKLGKKTRKKVPVVPNLDVQYHLGYKAFSGVVIQPDSIEVSGPEMQVKKIGKVTLEKIKLSNVKESINKNVGIVVSNLPKVSYSQQSVKVHIEVEKITEKTLEVPLQIINAFNNEVVIYPKKVKVSCQVRLSQFNQISVNDFVVVCDFNSRDEKHIKTEIIQKPSNVTSVKLHVDKVEYLILK